MTLPDPLHVLGVDELVAPLPHDVDWRQVHVVADSETQGASESLRAKRTKANESEKQKTGTRNDES